MDRKQWRELASDYIEGTLPAEKAKEVRAFLAQSPEARADESALRGITQHLKALPDLDPPLFFADNVLSRIQREQQEASQRGWRAWLPSLGRTALGSLAIGGILAAVAWKLLGPATPTTINEAGFSPNIPRSAINKVQPLGPLPTLKLTNLRHVEKALQFDLTLENADHGMVLASVPGAPQPTGVALGGTGAKTRPLEVPVAEEMKVASIKLAWTGDGQQGEQWVIEPLFRFEPLSGRLSFGLAEMPLTPQALEELARRFGQGIILVDVPRSERKVQFDARNETLEELLTRHLGPLGMTVTRAENRVIVSAKR